MNSTQNMEKLRGDVLIFNHFKYSPNFTNVKLSQRDGTQKDVEELQEIFSGLGLRVAIHTDLTHQEIINTLVNHANEKARHAEHDCLFVFVLTHGDQGGILFAHDELYRTDELWQPYLQCESLRGKPKIFIIQACRGRFDEALVSPGDDKRTAFLRSKALPRLPNDPDYLIAYSTVEHCKSVRYPSDGSWYIKMLCNEIRVMTEPTDLVELLTNVNRAVNNCCVQDIHNKNVVQTPIFDSFLNKKFYIPKFTGQQADPIATKLTEILENATSLPGTPQYDAKCGVLPSYQWEGRGLAIILHMPQHTLLANNFSDAVKRLRFDVNLQQLTADFSLTQNSLIECLEEKSSGVFGTLVIILARLVQIESEGLYDDGIQLDTLNYPTQNIWVHFTGLCCPKLLGKPKIFLYLDPGSFDMDSSQTTFGVERTPANDHADMFHLMGRGREFCIAVLNELQWQQPRELKTLCRRASLANYSDFRPHFQSTLRHQCVFSAFHVKREYEEDKKKRNKLQELEDAIEIVQSKEKKSMNTHNLLMEYSHELRNKGFNEDRLVTLDRLIKLSIELYGSEKNTDVLTHIHNKANTLTLLSRFHEALLLFEKVIDLKKHLLGHNHESTCLSVYKYAWTLGELQRYDESLASYEGVIESETRLLGKEHESTLISLYQKAWTLSKLRRYDEALAIYKQVFESETRVLGHEHASRILTLYQIAFTLGELHRYNESLAAYEEVIELRSSVLGSEHESTLKTLYQKAWTLSKLRRYDEALAMYMQVFESESRVLGHEHESRISTLYQIAVTLGELCRYSESLATYDQVIKLRSCVLGSEHESTLKTLYQKAWTLSKLRRYNEALAIYKQVFESESRVLGHEHESRILTLYQIAVTLGELHRYNESLATYEEVIELRIRILGFDHEITLKTLYRKAWTLSKLQRYDDTLAIYKQVFESETRVLGHEHNSTIMTLYQIAVTLGELCRYNESLATYEEVIELRRRVLGFGHESTLKALYQKAWTLNKLERCNESLAIYKQVDELETQVLGHEHKSRIMTVYQIAFTLGELQRYHESLEVYEQVYELRSRVLGHEHKSTIKSLYQKAWTLGMLQRFEESLALYEQVIVLETKVLGYNHKSTLTSMHNKAWTLLKLHRYEESLSLLEQVIKLRIHILHPEHEDTLASLSLKAFILSQLSCNIEALSLMDIIIKKVSDISGPEHELTLKSLYRKSHILSNMHRRREALELINSTVQTLKRVFGDKHENTKEAIEIQTEINSMYNYVKHLLWLIQTNGVSSINGLLSMFIYFLVFSYLNLAFLFIYENL